MSYRVLTDNRLGLAKQLALFCPLSDVHLSCVRVFRPQGSMRPTVAGSWLSSTSSQIASATPLPGVKTPSDDAALTATVAPQFFGYAVNWSCVMFL